MEIKPLCTETDYEAALKEVEKLIESQPGLTEGDRLDRWVMRIVAYEAKRFPILDLNDLVEKLETFMESRGITRSGLIPFLGGKERVSEILRTAHTRIITRGVCQNAD